MKAPEKVLDGWPKLGMMRAQNALLMPTPHFPSPSSGELPSKLCVILHQHPDHDSGSSILRSWVEFVEPADLSRKPVTFIDSILASQPQSRQLTAEVEGPVELEILLEEAFQNLLGVWPFPRQGLQKDLTTLGYNLDWNPSDFESTITPVTIHSM